MAPIHSALYEKLKKICLGKMPREIVFTYKGKVWNETQVYRIWKAAAGKAGLPHVSNYVGVRRQRPLSGIVTDTETLNYRRAFSTKLRKTYLSYPILCLHEFRHHLHFPSFTTPFSSPFRVIRARR